MSVNERRLKIIYDALDDNNNKKAIQDVNKLLKKDPNFVTAKILKGIALYRIGRQDEAESIIQPIESACPTEESILTALLHYYRETRCRNRFSKLLEGVCKKLPGNELYQQWLFSCYVRDHDVNGQVQAARQLCKAHPENELYFFFSVMSTLVQARDNLNLAQKMFYPLAERMLTTMASKRSLSLAECHLLFELQQLTAKFLVQLHYVDEQNNVTSVGDILLRPAEKLELLRTCLIQRVFADDNQWESARLRYLNELHNFLVEAPDDAQQWGRYIDSLLYHPSASLGSGEVSSGSLTALYEFLSSQSDTLRGPYLAKLHYQSHLRELFADCVERYPNTIFSIHDVIVDFFVKFSSRPSCALDLIEAFTMYNNIRDNDQELLQKLEATLPQRVEKVNDAYCLSNYETLCQYLGRYDSCTTRELLEKTKLLLSYYRQTLQIVESLPTEHNPGDSFLCLLVNLLFQCHSKSTKENGEATSQDQPVLVNYLLASVTILESVVQCDSPSNHNLRLRLVRLYQLLGGYSSSVAHFKCLEVKQLLLESISYFLTDFSVRTGHLSHAVSQWSLMENQLKSSTYELDDSLTVAYKEKNSHQILQFLDFHQRLQHSLTFTNAKWNQIAVEMLWSCHSFQQILDYITEKQMSSKLLEMQELPALVDGRDYTVVTDPFRRVNEKAMKEQRTSDEMKWLQLRRMTCSCMALCSKLVMDNSILIDKLKSTTSTNDKSQTESSMENSLETTSSKQLHQQLTSFIKLIEQREDSRGSDLSLPCLMNSLPTLLSSVPSLFEVYRNNSYTSIIIQGITILLQLRTIALKQDTPTTLNLREAFLHPLQSLHNLLSSLLAKHSTGECGPFVDVQSCAVVLTESISISVLFLSMLHSCLMPLLSTSSASSSKRRPGKKRGGGKLDGESNCHECECVTSSSSESLIKQRLQPVVNEWQECLNDLINWLQNDILEAKGVWNEFHNAVPQSETVLKNQGVEQLCQQFSALNIANEHLERLSETFLVTLTSKVVTNIAQDRRQSVQELRLVLQSKLQAAIALQKGNAAEVPSPFIFSLSGDMTCGFGRR